MNYKLFETHFTNRAWLFKKGDHEDRRYTFTKGQFELTVWPNTDWTIDASDLLYKDKLIGEVLVGEGIVDRTLSWLTTWADELVANRLSCIATIGDVQEVKEAVNIKGAPIDKLSRDKFVELYFHFFKTEHKRDHEGFDEMIDNAEGHYKHYLNS